MKTTQQQQTIFKLPESLWARCLLLIFVGTMLTHLFDANGRYFFWSFLGCISVLIFVNRQERQQQEISALMYDMNAALRELELLKKAQGQIEKGQEKPEQTPSAQTAFEKTEVIPTPNNEVQQPVEQEPDHQEAAPAWMSASQDVPQIHATADVRPPLIPIDAAQGTQSLFVTVMDWFKGGNSIVRIAVVILLIGVVLLLRFASEYWQLTLSAKMAGIALAGAGLTTLGYWLRHRRYEYAISLQGAGLGVLFLVLFSSYHLQAISSIYTAYVLLCALLAATLWLAIRQNALILAFVALASGFVAPFILNTGSRDIPALMAYLFVLNTALAVIAYFKPWRVLNTLALLMTFGIGGVAIWFYAQPEQHVQVACWVWAIFALYLFISIRYSQHIATLNTAFKDIPFIDTTLIFATPFMAFSLYSGLIDSNGQLLSIASVVLAGVYFAVGVWLHRKYQNLSMLIQCFYGLGLVFTALILPFALDAYWTSVGWAIHGFVVLWLGWRFSLTNAKYLGGVLLLASGLATLYAYVWHDQQVVFASALLMVLYACTAYLLTDRKSKPIESEPITRTLPSALFFLFLSFVISPYVYIQTLGKLGLEQLIWSSSVLLWGLLLSAALWLKDRYWNTIWLNILTLLLLLTTLEIMIAKGVIEHHLQLITLEKSHQYTLVWAGLLWLATFALWRSIGRNQHQTHAAQVLVMVLTTVALGLLAMIGGIWHDPILRYMWVLLPVLAVVATIKLSLFHAERELWVGNIWVVILAIWWLCDVSFLDRAAWALPYIPILNPIDIASLVVYALMVYALEPYLKSSHKEAQLISALVVLCLGLVLISSLLLRVLHHYAGLPYWSIDAWNNGLIQASLTLLWASTALILTTLASRRAWRYIWMLGVAVLAVVIFKLIFFDLSHSHTLTRIISFIGSGLIMLVIGYFSPLPPKVKQ